MKLTLTQDYSETTIEFKNIDVSLEQLFDSFKAILISATWSEKVIDEYIVELAEELKDK